MAFKILGNFLKKDQNQESNYLSLVLAPDRILAHIWTFEDDLVKTLGYGHKTFENEDVLVHQAAIAIDSAGEQAKVDITKTVFGVADYYLEDGSLSRNTSKLLKNLATELDLDPQAFVPISAGINHLLKVEESITPHVILVGIFGDFCEVHLLENGKVIATKTSKSPANIEKLKNLVNALKEEDRELPSRIVVYGISESAQLAEKIAKGDWNEVFVHEPKVDFLDDTELARAVAYAQAADVLGYDPQLKEKGEISKEDGQEEKAKTVAKSANELGFVEGEDILLAAKPPEESPIEEKPQTEPVPEKQGKQQYAIDTETPDVVIPPKPVQKGHKKSPLAGILALFSAFKISPKSASAKKAAVALVVIVALAIVGIFVYGQTAAKAEVVIKVDGKELEKDFTAKVVSGGNFDKEESQIGGRTITGKASGSQKAVTTGSKKLGESAKGEVTVYNWTNSEKSFSKGTGIISKNGVKFALDGDIQVASRSASSPGEAKVNVVAQDFGPSGNLEAGQDFSFQEFDELSYSAINQGAFSGGAERQTTVVTQQDMDKLEESLMETTTQKAREDLKNQAQGEKFDEDSVVVKVLKKQFDRQLDEEASLLNLDLEIEATALVYQEDDLKKLLAEVYQSEAPDNLEIRPENIKLGAQETEREDDEMEISGDFQAQMVPKFNEDELKDKIAGKSVKDARSIIKQMQEVAEVEVNFSPNLPIISSVPRNKNKISFKIETN
jgi:hypothetical protein